MKRTLALTVTALTLALSLSACGDKTDTQDASSSADEQAAAGSGGRGGMARPGSGKVAAVDGSTAQVQGSDSQTAVSWTGSTTFTQQVSATASDVGKGSCVVVSGEAGDSDDAITASSVRITEAVDGECTGPMGGGRGPGGNGGGERPTDMPTDMPSGAPDGERPSGGPGGGRGGVAVGTVTAVSADGFTVESVAMGAPGADDASSGAAETTSITVTATSDTTFTTSADASASDVEVGVCVTTQGKTDSTGAVAATSIAISRPTDGECSTGFGGRGGRAPQQDSE